jgi:ketose-bisphosphate aldolase
MSLAHMTDVLAQARQGGYALGYFESWDQYSFEAAVEAAEEARSPAIIGFGGAVADQAWLDGRGVEQMAAIALSLAARASIPAAVLFNEARTFGQVLRGLRAGCTAVMLDTSHLGFDDNVAATRRVVEAAHALGASVEAELGHLADGSDPGVAAVGTDPDEAARFVEQTGIDALAVSVGNVHILEGGAAEIDLERLAAIQWAVPVPLVIHGGTGFPDASVPAAVARGVAKFNVGTRLKRLYLDGLRQSLAELPERINAHALVGSREPVDVLMRSKLAVKAEIGRLMRVYGCAGRAPAR